MCVATAWLSTVLDEGRFGMTEQFFSSVVTETKASRVILPVFFGQTDACVTSKRAFEMMCELNPQVAKELMAIATSPAMTLCFYVFRKNFHGLSRESFAMVYTTLHNSPSGRQLATLFQFDGMTVRDVSCLSGALTVLDAADRARARRGAGNRKG
jgi:phosphonate transport system substrate-binding protein